MRIHHLARLAGIALFDGDDHEVVKDGFDGQIDVDQFGDGQLHCGKKDALNGFAHPGVFHGRLADDGRCVNGVFAMGDAGEVEDRVVIGHGVEAGVVAERAFAAEFAEFDVAFEDDFGVGGDFEVDGFALDDLDRLAAQEAGDHELFNFGRRGDDGGKSECRIGANGDGDFEPRAFQIADGDLRNAADGAVGNGDSAAGGFGHCSDSCALRAELVLVEGIGGYSIAHGFAIVFGGDFLALPVHAGGLAVVDLHAIHADVALARNGDRACARRAG